METVFKAGGFEIPNENAFQDLAADVGSRGEATLLPRENGVLHGRCLKLGAGLEIWMQYYESGKGEVVYKEYRPAFRARYAHKISPWVLNESDKDGKSVIHGYVEDTNSEVLFQLQNLTEIGADFLERKTLSVGLCGLAYGAELFNRYDVETLRSYDETTINVIEEENDWNVAGHIIAFDSLQNPQSGNDLYWIYVGMGSLQMEIIVSQRILRGGKPRIGAFIEADVWLQGHVLNESVKRSGYEGVDWSNRTSDFWKHFRKPN